MGYKITCIDQSESDYNNEGGMFCFILNGVPDEKWRQKFTEAMNSYRARYFTKTPLSLPDTTMIQAEAKLEGERGLSFVSELLMSILEEVNKEYDDELHAEADAERKKKSERAVLESKVSAIISNIKFS
ncbi:hypothetical protein [Enterobacter sp. 638]|uniref:hypothetical protein n=1 Tax=Enterobacter sp. (strain 638) TaxID=399742 RepID=UPI0005A2F6E2|nr:hypothetical protein [Enterobacter sp. 638]